MDYTVINETYYIECYRATDDIWLKTHPASFGSYDEAAEVCDKLTEESEAEDKNIRYSIWCEEEIELDDGTYDTEYYPCY